MLNKSFDGLKRRLEGDLLFDSSSKIQYATDASVYREIPVAIAKPKTISDIKELIYFARFNDYPIIPRGAGTSLAGQVVGNGIVVDISKYFNKIIELNVEEKWVKVQPGVILDELNKFLQPHGLFFGPETSTSNRCCIGGMFGNNSCGSHSILYGSTREHVLECRAILSDCTEIFFHPVSGRDFMSKFELKSREGELYRNIFSLVQSNENYQLLKDNYPDQSIKRRNTGYALDIISLQQPFFQDGEKFNFCKLLAGSEGTLAFVTELKLNLVHLPPKESAVVCVHFNSLEDTLKGNLVALKYNPGAVELIDKAILDCTKQNLGQQKNRFFIEGDPAAILVVEFARESQEEIQSIYQNMVEDFKSVNLGYHFPILYGNDINKVWSLRKAGLGLLSNIPGDAKPVAVIEDTAVPPEKLPEYIGEFQLLLKKYNLESIYYAHIGSGEIHMRPVLNLKNPKDVEIFHDLAFDVAKLVKKYKGSLSGEHGDGRLRGEFVKFMLGEKCYDLCRSLKETWDPENIFNPGKIVDAPKMNTSLRYETNKPLPAFETYFDFSKDGGFLPAIEKCNGSADCRKSAVIGGVMCPTFMATGDEDMTTRARANILREIINSGIDVFDSEMVYEILDNCVSCKGCKLECPSNIDMAKIKAEFLQHYYDKKGIPFRTRLITQINKFNKLGTYFPAGYNFLLNLPWISGVFKRLNGFAEQRNFPKLYKQSFHKWYLKNSEKIDSNKKVILFVDEFTEFSDVLIGITTYKLLTKLGYNVIVKDFKESGRVELSKGLIRKAREIANDNVKYYSEFISENIKLVGIEPSCILSFRDEYPDLLTGEMKDKARELAGYTKLIDEFISEEFLAGNISRENFTEKSVNVLFHGHCHQKTLAGTQCTATMLSIPVNYNVEEIKSGCCGMAGSFGYEKEHYQLSMKIGETVLFPAIRETEENTILCAPGTSCRHHIYEGTGRKVIHPVEVLYNALK